MATENCRGVNSLITDLSFHNYTFVGDVKDLTKKGMVEEIWVEVNPPLLIYRPKASAMPFIFPLS